MRRRWSGGSGFLGIAIIINFTLRLLSYLTTVPCFVIFHLFLVNFALLFFLTLYFIYSLFKKCNLQSLTQATSEY